jgi:hypothetical protein
MKHIYEEIIMPTILHMLPYTKFMTAYSTLAQVCVCVCVCVMQLDGQYTIATLPLTSSEASQTFIMLDR